jgi:hypothetical protein
MLTEATDPTLQRSRQAGVEARDDQVDQYPASRFVGSSFKIVLDCLDWLTVGPQPVGGPEVSLPLFLGRCAPEFQPKEHREEWMVSIGDRAVARGEEEQILSVQMVEQRAAVLAQGDRAAQLRVEDVEDRRADEKVPILTRDPFHDFAEEIVGNRRVQPDDTVELLVDVFRTSEPQRDELEGHRPSARPFQDDLQLIRRHRGALENVQFLGLVRAESQIGLPDLEEFAPTPEAVEPEKRIRSRGQNDRHLRR